MFILDGKPLSPDRAFTHAGVQYPANWLRLSSPEERAAIGITEAPDPPYYDQKFYWGYDQDGQLIPKDLDDLKVQWKQQQKVTASTLLTPTDWIVIRGIENSNKAVSQSMSAYRQAIRDVSDTREAEIDAVTTVEELVELLNTSITPWPEVIIM